MNRVAFGKLNRHAFKVATLVRPEPGSSRLAVWAAVGLLTGILVAAIECL